MDPTHSSVVYPPSVDPRLVELFNVILHAPAAAVREYLIHSGIDIERANEKGDTALVLAARRGEIEVVQVLIDPPVQANIHTRNLKGSNALIAAAMKGHTEICRLLLKYGADVNQTTDSNDTALSLAIWQNHTDVCLLLMHAGAHVDNVDKFGDCLSPDTRLPMADGTYKQVTQIKQGEWIIGKDGQGVQVEKIDTHRPTDALFHVHTHQSRYSVTGGHKLILRWCQNSMVDLTLEGDVDLGICLLRVMWHDPYTLSLHTHLWRCIPTDLNRATPIITTQRRTMQTKFMTPLIWADRRVEQHTIGTHLVDSCDADCTDFDPCSDSDFGSVDSVAPLVGLTCAELHSFGRTWLQHHVSTGRIHALTSGDLIQVRAEELFDRSRYLLSDTKRHIVASKIVKLHGAHTHTGRRTKEELTTHDSLHTTRRPIRTTLSTQFLNTGAEPCPTMLGTDQHRARVCYMMHAPGNTPLDTSAALNQLPSSSSSTPSIASLLQHLRSICQPCDLELTPHDGVTLTQLRPGSSTTPIEYEHDWCRAIDSTLDRTDVDTIVFFGSVACHAWLTWLADDASCSVTPLESTSSGAASITQVRIRHLDRSMRIILASDDQLAHSHDAHHTIAQPQLDATQMRPIESHADHAPIERIVKEQLPEAIDTVDIQVQGGLYVLENGILTHNSMLMDAAKHGNVAVMQLLLEKQGSHIDHVNKKGESALIRAAWKGELAALTLLLDQGANPAIVNKAGCTALIVACMHNNRACVKQLIERDTSPINAVDESGRSAFAYLALYAPAAGGGGIVEEPYWSGMELLLERQASIDTPPNMGNLVLCRAANVNQIRLASLLLAQGADINFSDPANKNRPALLAHLQGAPDLECTKFLVQNHARVDFQDTDGHTGLMFALKHNSPEITAFLLESGASTSIENKLGETAISMCMAMISNFQAHVTQLSQLQQQQHEHGEHHIPSPTLALHQLSLDRAHKCLQLLLDRSAREMGSGALLLQAAQHGDQEKLEEYLTIGVKEDDTMQTIDVNFTDKSGRSALMLSAKSNHLSCVKLLLHHGALLNLRDKDGLTALTLAIRSGSRDTAELLAETIQGHSLSRNFHFGGGLLYNMSTVNPPSTSGGVHGGVHGSVGTGVGRSSLSADLDGSNLLFPTPSAQVFGLTASPQQMAQEEFDKSTNFLVGVADQLRRYIVHGKQAAYDTLNVKVSPTNAPGDTTRSLELPSHAAPGSSPLHLTTPLATIPRSSSYFNSFPSPATSVVVPSPVRTLDPMPAIAPSPRHAEQATNHTPTHVAFRASTGGGPSTPTSHLTIEHFDAPFLQLQMAISNRNTPNSITPNENAQTHTDATLTQEQQA